MFTNKNDHKGGMGGGQKIPNFLPRGLRMAPFIMELILFIIIFLLLIDVV